MGARNHSEYKDRARPLATGLIDYGLGSDQANLRTRNSCLTAVRSSW